MRLKLITTVTILIALLNGSFAQTVTIHNYVFDCRTTWERSEDQLRTSSMLVMVKVLQVDRSITDIKDFIVIHNFTNGISIVSTERLNNKRAEILPKNSDPNAWRWSATNPSNPAYDIFGVLFEQPDGHFFYNEGYSAANNPQQSEEILKSSCRLLATQ